MRSLLLRLGVREVDRSGQKLSKMERSVNSAGWRERGPARRSHGSLAEVPERKELLAPLNLKLSSWLAAPAGLALLSFPWHSSSTKLRNTRWQKEGSCWCWLSNRTLKPGWSQMLGAKPPLRWDRAKLREPRPDNPASDLRPGTYPGSPASEDTLAPGCPSLRGGTSERRKVHRIITPKRDILKNGHVSKTEFTKATVRTRWGCHLSHI